MVRSKLHLSTSTFTLVFSALMSVAGCNGDDNNPAMGMGGTTTGSGGSMATGGAPGTGGNAPADAGTLYSRLGGHMGIRMAVDAIVADELMDPEIASFFAYQTSSTPTAGHPTADQLEECFTNQLGSAAGGPEMFPGALSSDHGGFVCRGNMAAIHAQFHISSAQFDKFVMIAGGTLTRLGVAPDDIATIATVLNSVKTPIVDPNAPGGPFHVPDGGSADAGEDAPTTLYQRLGGHTGIRTAIEHVVAAELADTTIAPYFSAQTATTTPAGHPNADQVEECLTNQLGAAAGGPETYPGTLNAAHGSWACRDMATIHQGMGITGATFDKFVMIAASTLTGLGVSNADVATLGSVLNGAKTAIVTGSEDAGHE